MAQEITKPQAVAPALLDSLPSSLRRNLARGLFDREYYNVTVTDDERAAATAAHRRLSEELSALTPRSVMEAWLAHLGSVCAAPQSTENAQVKIAAVVALLRQPPFCFTQDTLRSAAETFRFFPSFEELTAFFARIKAPREALRFRLSIVMSAKPPRAEVQPRTPEERAAFEAMMADLRAKHPWLKRYDERGREISREPDPPGMAEKINRTMMDYQRRLANGEVQQ